MEGTRAEAGEKHALSKKEIVWNRENSRMQKRRGDEMRNGKNIWSVEGEREDVDIRYPNVLHGVEDMR